MTCGYVVNKLVDNLSQLRITTAILWIVKKPEISAPKRLRRTGLQE